MPERKFLTADELATALGTHPLTVRVWARTGRIPALRFGGAWRFDLEAVLDAARREAATTAN